MKYFLDTLPNGLRVLTVPFPSMESATVTIWVNVGSRSETPRTSGVSHFLEHMVFKGSKKRPSAKAISEAIDSFGGQFNAGTSKDWTNFYIKSRVGKVALAFDVLADMVLNPLIPDVDMQREKGVIIEEIGMYEDTPMMHIGDVFENLIFKGNPLGRDIIGTRETVRNMKRNDFLRYRKSHYSSNNILVCVSGGVTRKKALLLAKEHMGTLKKVKLTTYKRFKNSQKKTQVLLSSQKKEQAHFILGFHAGERGHKDRYVEAVLSTILGGGMSSRLFTEVREKRGLAYSVRASGTEYNDTGYQEMYAGVDPKRVNEAVKVSLDQYYGLASGEHKIDSVELTKAKEYLKGHLALSLEDTRSVNRFFGIMALKLDKIETPDEVYEQVDRVEVKDVLRVAKKYFVPERLNFAIIGPYKSEDKFRKLLDVK